ncbi:MAG: efflux RND transporter permease subunit [Longimicrobiales bacterium]|nr:efflux RND transporter permease subunit [Longimicrobiales bacterium]
MATMVGLITLFGIAVPNGILLVSHYGHLREEEAGMREAVARGSPERLNPILMTALTAALALIPLALGGGEPGKEIQAPLAVVVLGGLITSTFLNMVVVPALYYQVQREGGERLTPAGRPPPAVASRRPRPRKSLSACGGPVAVASLSLDTSAVLGVVLECDGSESPTSPYPHSHHHRTHDDPTQNPTWPAPTHRAARVATHALGGVLYGIESHPISVGRQRPESVERYWRR